MHPRPLSRRHLVFVGMLLLAGASAVPAQETYYLLMFAGQQTPPNPNHAHTFATFVPVRCDGPTPGIPVIEAHTISWLAANLIIRVGSLLPEPGHNFELQETLRFGLDDWQRISLWGPYEIDRDLYCRALNQIQLLQSGQVRYKPLDEGYPTSRVSNCIHAVSSIVGGYRVRVLSPGWGETASFTILQRFRPWIVDQDRVHPWVGSALGLDAYPIIYRDFEHPRSGRFRGPWSEFLGRGRDVTPSYGPPLR